MIQQLGQGDVSNNLLSTRGIRLWLSEAYDILLGISPVLVVLFVVAPLPPERYTRSFLLDLVSARWLAPLPEASCCLLEVVFALDDWALRPASAAAPVPCPASESMVGLGVASASRLLLYDGRWRDA